MPALLLSIFLDLVGFGLILPLLPFYAQHFGASPLQIMLLASTFSVAQMVMAPVWGKLSDRLGRRPVLLLCLGLSVFSYLMLAMASSLLMLLVGRALGGGAAGKVSIAEAWVADVTPPERRAWGMGLVGAAMGAGYVVGPAAGGLLVGTGAVNEHWRVPALGAAILSLLALLLALSMVRESLHVAQHAGEGPSAPLAMKGLNWPGLAALIAIHFPVTFVFTLVEALFPLWAERRLGWGALQVGIAFALIGVLVVVMQGGLLGPLSRRLGEVRLMLAGLAAMAAGLGLIPAVARVELLSIGLCLVAWGIAAVMPTMTSLISKAAPPAGQGAVLGLANTAAGLGRVLGPACGGGILEWSSNYDMPYLLSGGLMLVTLLLALRASAAIVRPAV